MKRQYDRFHFILQDLKSLPSEQLDCIVALINYFLDPDKENVRSNYYAPLVDDIADDDYPF